VPQVVLGTAQPDVLQLQGGDVAGVDSPGGERSGVDAGLPSGHLGLFQLGATRELDVHVAKDNAADRRLRPGLDRRGRAVHAGRA